MCMHDYDFLRHIGGQVINASVVNGINRNVLPANRRRIALAFGSLSGATSRIGPAGTVNAVNGLWVPLGNRPIFVDGRMFGELVRMPWDIFAAAADTITIWESFLAFDLDRVPDYIIGKPPV